MNNIMMRLKGKTKRELAFMNYRSRYYLLESEKFSISFL